MVSKVLCNSIQSSEKNVEEYSRLLIVGTLSICLPKYRKTIEVENIFDYLKVNSLQTNYVLIIPISFGESD